MKKGFSLVAAMFFIILIATTAITALSISTMSAKSTVQAFMKEQAVLLAQSATEFAVMTMQSHYHKYDDSKCKTTTGPLVFNKSEKSEFYVVDNNFKSQSVKGDELPIYLATPDAAVLATTGTCLKEIHLTYPEVNNPLFKVNIKLYYLNSQSSCGNVALKAADSVLNSFDPICDEVSMMVDVSVKSTDNKTPITYRRRTLQTLL